MCSYGVLSKVSTRWENCSLGQLIVVILKFQLIDSYFFKKPCQNISLSAAYGFHTHSKVTSSRPGYYLILHPFGQRSQHISIQFPLYKQSENLGCATKRDVLLLAILW